MKYGDRYLYIEELVVQLCVFRDKYFDRTLTSPLYVNVPNVSMHFLQMERLLHELMICNVFCLRCFYVCIFFIVVVVVIEFAVASVA